VTATEAGGRIYLKIKAKFVSSWIQTRSRHNETSVVEVTPKNKVGFATIFWI